MKLFGSTKKLIDKTRNGENVPSLEVVKVVLVQCNLVDNQYQEKSEVLYTFTPNESYAYLSNVEPSNLVFLKTYNTEFNVIIGYRTRCCKNCFQKVVHKAGKFSANKIADVVTKSNDDKIVKQKPVEEIIIPLEKRDEILDKLRKVL